MLRTVQFYTLLARSDLYLVKGSYGRTGRYRCDRAINEGVKP